MGITLHSHKKPEGHSKKDFQFSLQQDPQVALSFPYLANQPLLSEVFKFLDVVDLVSLAFTCQWIYRCLFFSKRNFFKDFPPTHQSDQLPLLFNMPFRNQLGQHICDCYFAENQSSPFSQTIVYPWTSSKIFEVRSSPLPLTTLHSPGQLDYGPAEAKPPKIFSVHANTTHAAYISSLGQFYIYTLYPKFTRLGQFNLYSAWNLACAISSDSNFLVTGGTGNTLHLYKKNAKVKNNWQPESLRCEDFCGHNSIIMGVNFFDGDKKMVSCASESIIRVWDIEMKKEIRSLDHGGEGFTGEVCAVKPNLHDSDLFLSCGGRFIDAWDFRSSRRIYSFDSFPEDTVFNDVTWVTQNSLSGASDAALYLFDMRNQKIILNSEGCFRATSGSVNGRNLWGGSDSTLYLFDTLDLTKKPKEVNLDNNANDIITRICIGGRFGEIVFASHFDGYVSHLTHRPK